MSARRRAIVGLGSLIVVLLAVIPNVLFIDHWSFLLPAHESEAGDHEAHEMHCHLSATKCGSFLGLITAALTVGLSLIAGGGRLRAAAELIEKPRRDLAKRIDKPPRAVAFV